MGLVNDSEDAYETEPEPVKPVVRQEKKETAAPVAPKDASEPDECKELGLPEPQECKRCESGKCDPHKVSHCCDHELKIFDEFRIFFLGVIFHELSHWVAAKLAGIKVISYKLWHPKVAWVRIQNPQKTFNDVFVSFAPLVFGSIVASLLLISLFTTQMWGSDPLAFCILLFLAVSIAVHAPISKVDAYAAALALGLSYLRKKKSKALFAKFAAIFIWPFYVVAVALFKLSRFWFNLVQYVFIVAVFALLSALLFVR